MLPCSVVEKKSHVEGDEGNKEHGRRLLWYDHRLLSGNNNKSTCKEVRISMIYKHIHVQHLLFSMHIVY